MGRKRLAVREITCGVVAKVVRTHQGKQSFRHKPVVLTDAVKLLPVIDHGTNVGERSANPAPHSAQRPRPVVHAVPHDMKSLP